MTIYGTITKYKHRPGLTAWLCRELWRVLEWKWLHRRGYEFTGWEQVALKKEDFKFYGGYGSA